MSNLIVAVPSKGRLQENAEAFFARAGLHVRRDGGARNYRGRFAGVEAAEIAFLSASEIVGELAAGHVHLGVTGEDLVRERLPASQGVVELLTPLGFGQADVVVAVPRAWIDVGTVADLVDVAADFRAAHGRRLRVATKYATLAGRFFAAHGLTDYRIVESLGATEGAPAAGTADIVVDITTTGATLAANDLKVPDGATILKSQANLVAGLRANWSQTARQALTQVLDRIAAEERARGIHELRVDFGADVSPDWLDGLVAATGSVRVGGTGESLVLHVPKASLYDVVAEVKAAGAVRVSVFSPGYVFEARNPLLERLQAALGG